MPIFCIIIQFVIKIMLHVVCLFTGISDQGSYGPPEPTEEWSVKDRYKGTSTLGLFPMFDLCLHVSRCK